MWLSDKICGIRLFYHIATEKEGSKVNIEKKLSTMIIISMFSLLFKLCDDFKC